MIERAASHPQTLLLRLGLFGTTMVLFARAYDLWIFGQSSLYPVSLALSFAAWGLGALLGLLALSRTLTPRMAWLVLGGLILAFLASAYLYWRNRYPLITPRTDNEMISEYAVQILRRGQNPYEWNLADFRRVFHDQLNFTAFLDGSIQRRVTYPALPMTLLYVLDSIGLGSVKVISVTAHISLLILLFVGSPAAFRPVILLPLFALKEFTYFPLGGLQDVLWGALIVGMILAWNRPVLRAVLFGLACNYRQQPWLIAPFLVIYLWYTYPSRRERVRAIAVFGGISAGLFLIFNLPFFIWNPKAWILGAVEPSYAAFNVWSQGIASLTQFGFVAWPKAFYSVLQFSFYGAALWVYWRHPRSFGHAFWIVPGIFFWIYYRALTNYWIYWIPPLLLMVARATNPRTALDRLLPEHHRRWMPTASLCGALAAVNIVLGAALLMRADSVSAHYNLPILTTSGSESAQVLKLELEVTNHSDTLFEPRFSVQQEQPYPWQIESGPISLEPGESGTYVISAGYPAVQFSVHDGAQIVVTDAGENYALRNILNIPSDATFSDPDRIVNPRYEFWTETNVIPTGWTFQSLPSAAAAIAMAPIDGRDALILETDSRTILRLSQTITLPDAFDLWIYPTRPVVSPDGGYAYGLELTAGSNRLWVLFGDADTYGILDDQAAYIVMPAPLNTWSRQHIEIAALFERLGWAIPPLTMRTANSLSYPARQITLSLLLAAPGHDHATAVFGPIEQSNPQRIGSTDYLEQALNDPGGYYVGLGVNYLHNRNFDLALKAFDTARGYDPESSEAWFGLSQTYLWQGNWDAAMQAYQQSIKLGYPQPEQFYEIWTEAQSSKSTQ